MRGSVISCLGLILAAGCTGGSTGDQPGTPPGAPTPAPTPPPGGSNVTPTPSPGVTPMPTTPPPAPVTPPAQPEPTPATPPPDAAPATTPPGMAGAVPGTVSAFDGTTLTGWEGNATLWSVKDGALDGNGKTGGELLMTKEDYGDFRLIVQSRMVANQSGTGHLGICFYGGHMPVGKYNSCKLVIPPGGGSWNYAGSGGLPGITHPMTGKFNSSEWHTTELLCRFMTGTCRMATDGVEVLNYKEPAPAKLKKGPIGLQIHSGTSEVQYKGVFIDPAPTEDKLFTVK